MSASLVSSPFRRLAAPVLVALILAVALAPAVRAKTVSRTDSGTVARKVVVSDNGIVVVQPGDVVSRSELKREINRKIAREFGDESDTSDDAIGIHVPNVNVEVHGHTVRINNDLEGKVRVFSDVVVPAGETVDGDVVAVFGSATIGGHVTGSVVAVMGTVKLLPGAQVGEDAVAVGGGLDQSTGSSVGGETVSVGFLPLTNIGVPPLAALLGMVLIGWALSVFFAWLLDLLFRERLVRVALTASRQPGASFLVGLISKPLLIIAIVLLVVTVIGIPVAFMLPLAYTLALWAGQLAVTYLLGCRLMGRRAGEATPLGPIVAGSLFVAMFFVAGALLATPPGFSRTLALFFGLVGVLLLTGLSIMGVGAFLISRGGGRAREAAREPGMPPAVPPGSPLPAPAPPAA